MTDLEWDRSTDPLAMIRFVADYERSAWVARKLRLFAAGCCRLVWTDMPDWRSREAVEEAERVVSGVQRPSQLAALQAIANEAWSIAASPYAYWYDDPRPGPRVARPDLRLESIAAGRAAAGCADPDDPVRAATEVTQALGPAVAAADLCDLLRDVCGNPYRRLPGRRWWSSDVRAVARTIEAGRVFRRMPILGDALMDAGLDHEETIRHCQAPVPHVLGCWVLDLALGRD